MCFLYAERIRILLLFILTCFISLPSFSMEPDFPEYIVKKRNVIYGEDAHQFVNQFRKIVKNKNVTALKKLVTEETLFSFGGHSGINGLTELWKLNHNPENSSLWLELQTVLDMGGVSKSGKSMSFPYLFTDWPENDNYDVFEYKAITGSKVNLRTKPSLQSKIIRQISYEIVKPLGSDSPESDTGWTHVQTHDRKTGYVSNQFIRSPIDYRLGFQKEEKGWRLAYFLAGD